MKENKLIKIAVIDSGIDPHDTLLSLHNISALKVQNGQVSVDNADVIENSHGRNIMEIILRETNEVKVISIRVLNDKNKGDLKDLCCAINYCIAINVNIINLSLGISSSNCSDEIIALCNKAERKGIVVIAAETNKLSEKSVIANLNSVIGVKVCNSLQGILKYNEIEKECFFKSDSIYVSSLKDSFIKKGNSFLTGFLTGMYANYLGTENAVSFQDYLKDVLMLDYFNSGIEVYFKKNYINKTIFFINDDVRLNKSALEKISQDSSVFSVPYMGSKKIIQKYAKKGDCVFLGIPGDISLKSVEDIIFFLVNENIAIFMIIPIVNTLKRRAIFNITKCPVFSIYL